MFSINLGKGFSITFQNNYTISVQFGLGNYCKNYDNNALSIFNNIENFKKVKCNDAEIAIIDPDGNFIELDNDENVKGYCDSQEVLKWINYASKL